MSNPNEDEAAKVAKLAALQAQLGNLQQQRAGYQNPGAHHHHHHNQQNPNPYQQHQHYHQHQHNRYQQGNPYQQQHQQGNPYQQQHQQGNPYQQQQQNPYQQQHHKHHQQHHQTQYATEYDDEEDEDYEDFEEADMLFAETNQQQPTPKNDELFDEMLRETGGGAGHASTAVDADQIFAIAKVPKASTSGMLMDLAKRGMLRALRDNKQRTVLHYVAESGNAALAQELATSSGVDVNAKDDDGLRAGDVAVIVNDGAMAKVFGLSLADRSALLSRVRIPPPKFTLTKTPAPPAPHAGGTFWGAAAAPVPPADYTLAIRDLYDEAVDLDVPNAVPPLPVSPLDWTQPAEEDTPAYQQGLRVMRLLSKDGKVAAKVEARPIAFLVARGATLPQDTHCFGRVKTAHGALRPLLEHIAAIFEGTAVFVSSANLAPVLPPICAVKWFQRSINGAEVMENALVAPLLFPDLKKYYAVTRADIIRRHEVTLPAGNSSSGWRLATEADANTLTQIFERVQSKYEISFPIIAESIQHISFGADRVTLVREDGGGAVILQRRTGYGLPVAIVVLAALGPDGFEGVCAAARSLIPDLAVVFASGVGTPETELTRAGFVALEAPQYLYAASSPNASATAPAAASKVLLPMTF
jgi:hypothetical protein